MSNVNPLDHPGQVFDLALMNPNPSGSKTKQGPVYRVSFEIDQEWYIRFMDAKTSGMMIAAKCTVFTDNPPEEKPKSTKGPHGDYWMRCVKMGAFTQWEVAKTLGGDEDYKKWIRLQPDFLTGKFSEDFKGEGRCVYAHVPDASRPMSDKEKKVIFSGLPMEQVDSHLYQHNQGWRALFEKHGHGPLEGMEPLDEARKYRDKYLFKWIKSRLYATWDVDSLSKIDPVLFYRWATDTGISKYFPSITT